ncbi:Malate/lactate/ureidoglycolate dehydrogenase, LDH2 family [Vreelandella subterranea]|uniref:Malate/lactate/ureidoglycolate dehydrogenase, LDH2 family n=1 Tax=Vreelandella subterranea TaxID=416874 RepID=A0A1H9R6Q5_9GAMM|nr:Ldh family oxidoreductase [Halomonas subterranea]SER68215.1 Malate/lactate/ureidoglycolate dehydrogenase, LDH2 family [Halomonas subterranea]
MTIDSPDFRVAVADLEGFIARILHRAGADAASAQAVTRALVTASRMGTDSHGLRLLPHYIQALQGGRINGRPKMQFSQRLPATGYLDADDGLGHLAGYTAMAHAADMAEKVGLGAVAVGNSSHFGAAGCYALAAAERGLIGMAFCNSDPFVLLHEGRSPFHGTNPIAFAAPVNGQAPYLLDMATSSVPWNRVQQYGAIGRELPDQVAADAAGRVTRTPAEVSALLPLGGSDFGFKGAGLGGMVEILSSTLSGMLNGFRLLPMGGPDMATPRGVGHFFLAMNPDAFNGNASFETCLREYLEDLRAQPANEGAEVLAPGDREWRCLGMRDAKGIPLDRANQAAYAALAEQFDVEPLTPVR